MGVPPRGAEAPQEWSVAREMQHVTTVAGRTWPGVVAFVAFAAVFLLQEVYRTVLAVAAPSVAADTDLSAADVGFVTSIYFLAFAAVQLPLGILLDRFGPRRVVAAFLLFGAGGAAVFAISDGMTGLAAGRALTGLGMSCCLMAAFKANTLWWPSGRLVLANGGVLTIGSLGVLIAATPLEHLLAVVDWRVVFLGLGAVTLFAAGAVHSLVPEPPPPDQHAERADWPRLWRELAAVLRSAVFWRFAPVTMLTQAMWIAYQGLWAAPWLETVASLDRPDVIRHLVWLAVAIAVGFFFSSVVIDALRRRGWSPPTVIGIGMALFLLVQLLLVLDLGGRFSLVVWVAFGLFGTVSVAFYAILSQAFSGHLAGRVNTTLNLLVFVSAFLIQFGVGEVIELWPARPDGGHPAVAHRAAMGILLALQALAFLWFLRPVPGRQD
jgi:MFS family permease